MKIIRLKAWRKGGENRAEEEMNKTLHEMENLSLSLSLFLYPSVFERERRVNKRGRKERKEERVCFVERERECVGVCVNVCVCVLCERERGERGEERVCFVEKERERETVCVCVCVYVCLREMRERSLSGI